MRSRLLPLLAALSCAAPALAQTFGLKGFEVTGDNPLDGATTTRILAPFLREDASLEILQRATAALEAELRARGYSLYRVALPPQTLGDTVSLTVVRFTLNEVVVSGARHRSEDNVRASLPELRPGHSPNIRRLAVQTALANENPSRQVTVALRESPELDQIDAEIQVRDSRPWNLAVNWNNAGSSQTGHDRLTVAGSHHNLFDRDHQFAAAYTTSLDKPSNVRQLGLSYRVPLYALGGSLGASFTTSDVVGDFGVFTSSGAARTFGLQYVHYLQPQGGRRSYVTLGLEDRWYEAGETLAGGVIVPAATVDRRSRPLSLGYVARVEGTRSLWGYQAELVWNTGSGSGNNLNAYRSENPGLDRASWHALRLGANYSAGLGNGWVWSLRAQGQWSPHALIAGEQFGLGGANSVRGAAERAISADSGLQASAEITTPELAPGLRLAGFIDAGWLRNQRSTATGRLASDQIASVGVGLRYGHARGVAVSLDYGHILSGSASLLTLAPRKGDHKLHFSASFKF